ncbi:MAG: pyridoxal kinase PdxY [Geminicoccaceae bacterium]|nr:pyridoxal kinase PdxY [Geminicoccaceae bacterium]
MTGEAESERAAGGILSIQSQVAYGHVGNSAAVFPLQRLGFEVWPVPTVLFSNHTGYGAWRGHVLSAAQVRDILLGVAERGVLTRCGAVVSGYLGDVALGRVVLDAVREVRALRPDMLWVCDPVMGDVDLGFFVEPDIPAFFRDEALEQADVLTPNLFELGVLTDRSITTLAEMTAAADTLLGRGAKMVAVTSIVLDEADRRLAVALLTREERWIVHTPRLDLRATGTGDAFTALLLGHWLRTRDCRRTLEAATSAMFALVEATMKAGATELALIEAQDAFARPRPRFRAAPL